MLATAAARDGYHVRGLDQIGLSQKAGPVVSDVRISHGSAAGSNRVGAGQADLLLAFDLLVGSSWNGLEVSDPARTSVVGSLDLTPPGAKTAHPEIEMPSRAQLLERIAASTRPDDRHWAEASAACEVLVGDPVGANIFVVGMATQAGLLPISPSSIEEAITLNGVAVDLNLAAFRWGRWHVADRAVVDATLAAAAPPTPVPKLPGDLADRTSVLAGGDAAQADRLRMLTADLIGFQNRKLAVTFLDRLEEVRAEVALIDRARTPLVVDRTAAGLHKLLAYKDEYEVARLMLDPDGHSPVARVAGRGDRVAWRLHPPLLRSIGRTSKISLSTRWRPVIAMLRGAKRLRGTPFDPFGRTRVRRVERQLAAEYLDGLHRAVAAASESGTLDTVLLVAELPDLVRGYEDIKLRNVERFRTRMAELIGS